MSGGLAAPAGRTRLLAAEVDEACSRIAPTWPLDRFIAVNPYWCYADRPIEQAAAELRARSGTSLLMPRSFYREQWRSGRILDRHLRAAIELDGDACTAQALVESLDAPPVQASAVPLVTDVVANDRVAGQAMTWRDLVTHQISQHCAAYFDHLQAAWRPESDLGLYGSWRQATSADRSLPLRRGHVPFRVEVLALPANAEALIAFAVDALGVSDEDCSAYLGALLQSISGWAAWCAYLRWQARLAQDEDTRIVELLAIRLAWEWLLLNDAEAQSRWHAAQMQTQTRALVEQTKAAQRFDWMWQYALEASYQEQLCHGLAAASQQVSTATAAMSVQAAFCIDVRSEVFRRALEAANPGVQTLGFAGFFGLPIAYSPLGSALTRPQLPGLLAPALCVSEACEPASSADALRARRQHALRRRQSWSDFRLQASSGFSFVESMGLLYAGKLLRDSLPSQASASCWEHTGLPRDAMHMAPRLGKAGGFASETSRAELALSVLRAMSLTSGFAPLVLLAGHGSQSANNPHAAGLDCGACGGQTGEVNARVLAALLNETRVRQDLRELGVDIPDETLFIAGLHNTTTDDVTLFDLDELPAAHTGAVTQLQAWLEDAGRTARSARATALGLDRLVGDDSALHKAIKTRANDWAQVRPEWGLADNASFIVAPRERTRHLDLHGRSFLHEYRWQDDGELKVLELIMTAPMVVTNWINLQYHASTVDNRRYGSGNKVLHNVVGGNLGVFEGNGGDLRIGLPWQSLHDGHALRHTPLRLSVFIEAPRHALEQVIAAHAVVRQLLDHRWLHLLQIEPAQPQISRYDRGVWRSDMTTTTLLPALQEAMRRPPSSPF